MIKVVFKANAGLISMEMTGHADFAEHGKDLVCAWASGLGYTMANEARTYAMQGDLLREPTIIIKPGHLKVSCRPRGARYAEVLHSFFVVQGGLRVLEGNTSGKYCTVTTFDQGLTPEQHDQLSRLSNPR